MKIYLSQHQELARYVESEQCHSASKGKTHSTRALSGGVEESGQGSGVFRVDGNRNGGRGIVQWDGEWGGEENGMWGDEGGEGSGEESGEFGEERYRNGGLGSGGWDGEWGGEGSGEEGRFGLPRVTTFGHESIQEYSDGPPTLAYGFGRFSSSALPGLADYEKKNTKEVRLD